MDIFKASIFHSKDSNIDFMYLTIDGKLVAMNAAMAAEPHKIKQDAIAVLDNF